MTEELEVLDAQTHHVPCGCGNIYVIINSNGDFHSVTIKGAMAKEAPCGEAWFNAMGAILTFALRRAIKEDEDALYRGIIKQLKNQNCNMTTAARKSCVHQIATVIEKYFKGRAK